MFLKSIYCSYARANLLKSLYQGEISGTMYALSPGSDWMDCLMLYEWCMKQKHLVPVGPGHAPNQHTQYVTLPFSYTELIVS